MDYVSLDIDCTEEQSEILTAFLADYPFESFDTEAGTLRAFIPADRLAECRGEVDALLRDRGVTGRYVPIATQNWNAVWESDFPQVEVDGRLIVRAPFHAPAPEGILEVVLTPRMSFGTGHHATTWLMSRAVLDLQVAGHRGLDLGSGTGVLAIVAAKCGAEHVDAVDVDDWADASCRENIVVNGVGERVEPILGDVRSIAGRRYDFILANINRNILLAALPACAAALRPGGDLLLSGFLAEDVPILVGAAAAHGLEHVATDSRDGWMMIRLKMKN